jgi:hypothetical protein
MSRVAYILTVLTGAVAAILVLFHLVVTTVYVSPPSPAKNAFFAVPITQYIDRYFYQDWGLFAPNPISMDIDVLVACVKGSLKEKPINITSPLHARRYILGLDRVNRVAVNYAYSYITPPRTDSLILDKLCQNSQEHPACESAKERLKLQREAQREGLRRVASAFCADLAEVRGQGRYRQADIWIVLTHAPRWENRKNAKREQEYIFLGRVNLDQVPPPKIWRVEE